MNKTLLAGLVAASAASALQASPIGLTGSINEIRQGGYYTGSGGEFTISGYTGGINNASYFRGVSDNLSTKDVGSYDPSFQTFCIELGENAASPTTYTVNSAAVMGGTTTSDPLSKGTSWLYSQFAQGILNISGGDYFSLGAPARSVEAGLLQNAIWSLEDEQANPVSGTNPYYDAALLHGGEADAAVGENGVYVLNNMKGTTKAQDFLYYSVPDGGTTVMLLGMGIGGLAFVSRRNRK